MRLRPTPRSPRLLTLPPTISRNIDLSDQPSQLCVTSPPSLPSWPDSPNNRSDRRDLREQARRLRRTPINWASGESIDNLRTELSSLSQPYCSYSVSNK